MPTKTRKKKTRTPERVADPNPEQQAQAALLAEIPNDAQRVRVRDKDNKWRWRKLDAVLASDSLEIDPKTKKPYTMLSEPGRRQGETPDPYVLATSEKRKRHLSNDDLLQTIQEDPSDVNVLDQVMSGLAEEAATIKFEQSEAERKGQSVTNLADKRIRALRAVSETWLNRKDKLQMTEIDLASNTFKILFGFITETFRDAMADTGMRAEAVDAVFNRVSQRMRTGWEAEARNRMKRA